MRPSVFLQTSSPRVSLEELQRQQRDIEAENKKRKALIEQALQERWVECIRTFAYLCTQ